MNALCKDNIVDLFVWVDDSLRQLGVATNSNGRPPVLSRSEIVTILIWDGLAEAHRTLKDTYRWIKRDYGDCFPKLPAYQNFVLQAHNSLEAMSELLLGSLNYDAELRFADSTMLEVCALDRSNFHKVAKEAAKYGKNHQGWHYGFKLHASIDEYGNLTGVCFTPADVYDAQRIDKLVRGKTKTLVGDSHYGASVMKRKIHRETGAIIIAQPHYRQKKGLTTKEQRRLLRMRTKIEAVFDYLKEHMGMVTSFPRSVRGYFVHYVRILLGYQMRRVS